MGNLKYCSSCGARNETRELEGRRRKVCPRCGTVHYENPRPAVTVVAVRDGQLLLVRRAVPPAEVCPVCGDVLLNPETVRRIEVLLQTPPHPVNKIPLYEYA